MLGLKTGARLNLTFAPKAGDNDPIVLISSFESEDERNQIIVSAPIYMGTVYPMPVGGVCELSFTDQVAVYSCDCRVGGRFQKNKLDFNTLELISEVRRVQRRENFRLRVVLPGTIKRRFDNGQGEAEEKVLPARTIDISGGGAAVYLSELLPRGEDIELTVRIAEFGTLSVNASVCWSRQHPEAADRLCRYSCGMLFHFKDGRDKENLIKYVFSQQLKQRREGLALL